MKTMMALCLIAILCLLTAASCAVPPLNEADSREELSTTMETEAETFAPVGAETSVKLMQYSDRGFQVVGQGRVLTRTIADCDIADALVVALAAMPETGETVESLSDEIVTEESRDLSIAPGIMWIEVGDAIFRVNHDATQICRVGRHLGEGNVLLADETFWENLSDAWYYHPYDSYSAVYENGELTVVHEYEAPTTVSLKIKEIVLATDEEQTLDTDGTLIVEVCSTVDQTVTVWYSPDMVGCVIYPSDGEELTLKQGETQTVELVFHHNWGHTTAKGCLSVDNIRVHLTITESTSST